VTIQTEIGHWQHAAFPNEMNHGSRFAKIVEEFNEFADAYEALCETIKKNGSIAQGLRHLEAEAADVFITMYGFADVLKFDLNATVRQKFEAAKEKHPPNAEMASYVEIKPIRASPDQTWMEVAQTISKRSTCPRLNVGAVLVGVSGEIVSTGYNGAPRGLAHCSDIGCLLEPETGRCKRTVHAEQNALLQADAKRMKFATLYVTHEPCIECSQMILNSGVDRVVYEKPYSTKFSETEEMFRTAGINIGRIQSGA
jgi:dCMP deaminase